MNILGLDISTAIIGYCIISINDNKEFAFEKYDYIDVNKLVNSEDENDVFKVFDKIYQVMPILERIIKEYKIEKVYIESPNKLFKTGLSSIEIITKLLVFNYVISDNIRRHIKLPIEHINARSARSIVFGKSFNSPSLKEFGNAKTLVFNNLMIDYPQLEVLKTKLNRNNNLHSWVYDICDSIVIALFGAKKIIKNSK